MEKRNNAIAIAQPYFEGESKHEILHVTSDGQVFSRAHEADGHAQRLKVRDVEVVTKADVETINIIAEAKKEAAKKEAAIEAEKQAAITAEKEAAIESEKEAAKLAEIEVAVEPEVEVAKPKPKAKPKAKAPKK